MKLILCAVCFFLASACGVKGDPVPPGTPAELGRGQPTYKKAAEEFAFPDLPPIRDEKKKNEE